MSGVVSHLAVGGEILRYAGVRIKDKCAFLTGNIAPDGVHFREGYERSMKKFSHLRQGIDDRDFLLTPNLNAFHERLDVFQSEYCKKCEENYDFMCGYLAHLITDELYIKTVRKNYVRKMASIGIDQKNIEFFHKVTRDTTGVDCEVAKNFNFHELVFEVMKKPIAYDVGELVKQSETERSLLWIRENYFLDQSNFQKSVYLTLREVNDFINYASKEVYRRLLARGLY